MTADRLSPHALEALVRTQLAQWGVTPDPVQVGRLVKALGRLAPCDDGWTPVPHPALDLDAVLARYRHD